jgi:hypothetical protein
MGRGGLEETGRVGQEGAMLGGNSRARHRVENTHCDGPALGGVGAPPAPFALISGIMTNSAPLPADANELARLEQLRSDLLRVHRALLDVERRRYEAVNGPVPNNSAFLQLVINDPWFEWLRPMAQMVLLIDERSSDKKSRLATDEAAELYRRGRALLTPDAAGDSFQRLFHDAVSHSQSLAVLVHHVNSTTPN